MARRKQPSISERQRLLRRPRVTRFWLMDQYLARQRRPTASAASRVEPEPVIFIKTPFFSGCAVQVFRQIQHMNA